MTVSSTTSSIERIRKAICASSGIIMLLRTLGRSGNPAARSGVVPGIEMTLWDVPSIFTALRVKPDDSNSSTIVWPDSSRFTVGATASPVPRSIHSESAAAGRVKPSTTDRTSERNSDFFIILSPLIEIADE